MTFQRENQRVANGERSANAFGRDDRRPWYRGIALAVATSVVVALTGCLAISFEYSGSKKAATAPAEEEGKATETVTEESR